MTDKRVVSIKKTLPPKKILLAASNSDAILRLVAGEVWAKNYNGEICPVHRIPKPEGLIFDEFENSQDTWREVGGFMRPLFPPLSLKMDSVETMLLIFVEARSFGRPGWIEPDFKMELGASWIELIHRRWREAELESGGPVMHPLGPLVRAWQEHGPIEVFPNIQREDRILPSGCAMVPNDHAKAGKLFAPAAHFTGIGEGQGVLPGFEIQRSQPSLPLELYDLSVGPKNSLGHGAPLALRLWIEAILAIGLNDRGRGPVVLKITLRDLLGKLYPRKRPPRRDYWPRLTRAVEALDKAWIPWFNADIGKGGRRRIVLVSQVPRGPGALDDEIKIIVDLPPDVGAGPVVSPRLAQWGTKSASGYRALLNLAFLWFQPGKTRTPVRGRRHWLQSSDPTRYEKVTDGLLIQTFYPTSTKKNQRELARRAQEVLAKLEGAKELRIVKDGHGIRRLMPPNWMYGRDTEGNLNDPD